MRALRKLREKAGLTQFVIAKRSGVTRMRLSLAECGQLRLTAKEETAVRKAIRQGIAEHAARLQGLLNKRRKEEELSLSA